MRLTLRTLLAWLDNLLPRQEQGDLADKVATSGAAPVLIRRIRETVARSTLPAPRVDGRGLAEDPNKAAEYLDNTMEPALLEAFEKVCIESDVHLAEIAACHGMLAEMFRDQGIVQPLAGEEKKRLLRAVRHHLERPRETEREAAIADGRSVREALAAAAEPCNTELVLPAPPSKKEPRQVARPVGSGTKPTSRRAAWLTMAAAVAVLLTLIGVLAWSLNQRGRKGESRELAAARPAPAVVPPVAASSDQGQKPLPVDGPAASAAPPAGAVKAAPPQPANAAGKKTAQQTNTSPERPALAKAEPLLPAETPAATASPPPPAQEAPTQQPPPAATVAERPAAVATGTTVATAPAQSPAAGAPLVEQPRVPQGDALAIAAGPPAAALVAAAPAAAAAPQPPQPATAAAVLAPPVPVAAEAAAGIVLDSGVLLRRSPANRDQGGLQAVAAGGEIGLGDDLLVPSACRPTISVGGVQVDFEPHSRAAVTRDADGTPRLELIFGRATVRSAVAAARLGITAGGLAGVITAGLRGPVGIEVELALDAGADPATAEARTRARIVTGSSAIAWQQTQADGTPAREPLQGIAPQGMLDPSAALVWDSRDPGSVMLQRGSTADWMPGRERSNRIDDAAAQTLAGSVAEGRPVMEALHGLARDRRAENRMAAAATLALMGEYGPLVDLLCAESGTLGLKETEWSRLEQSTVPLALARGAKSAARLQQAFAAKLPGDTAADIFALARGVSPADLAADGGQRLVDALEDDQLVVRRYAWKTLADVVQPTASERLQYRPDRPAEQRREGVAWWRRQLAEGRIRHSPARGDSGAPPAE